jgi:hypothetical protein
VSVIVDGFWTHVGFSAKDAGWLEQCVDYAATGTGLDLADYLASSQKS